MKKYENLDNFQRRDHVVEVTLQLGKYKGTFKYKMGGNCFGFDILQTFDPDEVEIDDLIENECSLKIIKNDDGEYWFTCVLIDDEGISTSEEDELNSLKNLVVKLEIVDCTILPRKEQKELKCDVKEKA